MNESVCVCVKSGQKFIYKYSISCLHARNSNKTIVEHGSKKCNRFLAILPHRRRILWPINNFIFRLTSILSADAGCWAFKQNIEG